MSEQPEHEVVRDWFEPGLSIPDGALVMVHYALVAVFSLSKAVRKVYWLLRQSQPTDDAISEVNRRFSDMSDMMENTDARPDSQSG